MNHTCRILGCLILGLPQVGLGHARNSSQDEILAPSIFRNVRLGHRLPAIELQDSSGKKVQFATREGTAVVIAFVRPQQKASQDLIQALGRIAVEPALSNARLVAIGVKSANPRDWTKIQKGMPRKIEFYLDLHGASAALGVLVRPSIGILDLEGRLCDAFALFDEDLGLRLKSDLEDLSNGRSPLDAESRASQRRFAEISATATFLERKGDLKSALLLRKSQLTMRVKVAEVRWHIGQLLLRLGSVELARAELQASLELEESLHARIGLAKAALEKGDIAEMAVVLKPLSGKHRDQPELLRLESVLARERGDLKKAILLMKKAIAALRVNRGRR